MPRYTKRNRMPTNLQPVQTAPETRSKTKVVSKVASKAAKPTSTLFSDHVFFIDRSIKNFEVLQLDKKKVTVE